MSALLPPPPRSHISEHLYRSGTRVRHTMASDEDYMAFLDKANQDPNEGISGAQGVKDQGKVELKAVDGGVEVPAALVKATEDAFYVSDADEPFVPVALKLGKGKGLPDEGMFTLLHFL